jgi:hypothetical protein
VGARASSNKEMVMAVSPITTINVSTQKADLVATYRALIQGINSRLAGIDSFTLGKQTFSRADFLSRLQSRIDMAETVKADRATLQKSVADERTLDIVTKPLRAQMKIYLQARFGKESPELQDFGFTQSRTPKPSAGTKAAAVTQAKATRAARGTKGTQQKKAIKAPRAAATPQAATTPVAASPAATAPAATPPATGAATNPSSPPMTTALPLAASHS